MKMSASQVCLKTLDEVVRKDLLDCEVMVNMTSVGAVRKSRTPWSNVKDM